MVCFLSKIAVSNGLTRAGAFGSLTKTLCWTFWIFTKSQIWSIAEGELYLTNCARLTIKTSYFLFSRSVGWDKNICSEMKTVRLNWKAGR